MSSLAGPGTPSPDGPGPRAAAVIEGYFAGRPELPARRVGPAAWLAVLPGEVRQAIPVALDLGTQSLGITGFLLRGPRPAADAARLHGALLRRNAVTLRSRLCLDADGDVLIVARIPVGVVDETELDAALGEIHALAEATFEPLVHLAYPGVFPPLRRAVPEGTPPA